ncbi:MAG: hypothetical protein Kow0027_27720 [Saprospiraceae bacterium]
MANLSKNAEELRSEILHLRRQNQNLQEQLSLHQRIIKEMRRALDAVQLMDAENQSRHLANKALDTRNEKLEKLERLTRRERQVLKLISKGFTSRQIAEKLGISKLTIDTHRKNIQRKLEVSNTVELLKLAMYFI